MHASGRHFLSLLAIVGSLDIGFSFANAKSSSSSRSTPFGPQSKMPFLATTTTTATTVGATTRRRPTAVAAAAAAKHSTALLDVKGGGGGGSANADASYKKLSVALTSLWGSGGVIYILAKAIKRVVPIAMEPFAEGAVPLSQVQLGIYIATCLWFAYVEGYKGFQTKFSPLVVQRSLTLQPGQSKIHHILFAPLYSMGLFHATRKRKIVSWSVTLGVTLIVAAVKRMPYPWRNIIDAGVVAGLSWGSLSILVIYLKAWIMGQRPDIDAALP